MATPNSDSIDAFLESLGLVVEKPGQPAQPYTGSQVPLPLPNPALAQGRVEELALALVTQPGKAHLYLYMAANERMIDFPLISRSVTFKINYGNLEGFVSECETELIHRGFRLTPEKQMDGNGKLIAQRFTFDDLSKRFAGELGNFLSYFQKRYPLKPQ